uniref:Knr4/Smi1-like domain-containing protein n=1 Tax=Bicosoecida sp. CB-2014 TaxID=1486930 RepID=A0A7S1G240_9STRA
MAAKTVTVAVEGNARVGGMTSDEEEQCVRDIHGWFVRNAKESGAADAEGASEASLEALSKAAGGLPLPSAYVALLKRADGGGVALREFSLLSAGEAADAKAALSGDGTDAFLPVARDLDDNLLGLVYGSGGASEGKGDDGSGGGGGVPHVAEWSADEGVSEAVAGSFADYLEAFRNELLASKYEWLEGLVERITDSPVKKGKK